MQHEAAQWRIRCATDGDVYVTLPSVAPPPTVCPNDPAHQFLGVSLHRHTDASFEPATGIESFDAFSAIGGDGIRRRHAKPITSPAGWLANAAGQLLVQG